MLRNWIESKQKIHLLYLLLISPMIGCAGMYKSASYLPPTPSEASLLQYEQAIVLDKYDSTFWNEFDRLNGIFYILSRWASSWCDEATNYVSGYGSISKNGWDRNSAYRYIPHHWGETVQYVVPHSEASKVLIPGDVVYHTLPGDHPQEVKLVIAHRVGGYPFERNLAGLIEADTVAIYKQPACSKLSYSIGGPVNASTDGKIVYISQSMIDFTEDDNELAFIIAHEIAHIASDHIGTRKDNATVGGIFGAILGGTLEALTGVYGSGRSMTNAGYRAGAMAHSVEFEREADHLAIALLIKAGYDASAGAALWDRLAKASAGAGYGSTHPSYGTRSISIEVSKRQFLECPNVENLSWREMVESCG